MPLLKATTKALLRLRAPVVEKGEDLIPMCYMSDDFREGKRAFLEKRPPSFRGA